MAAEAQRLNRYLAACGLGSRRGVETLVAEGRVDDRRRRRRLRPGSACRRARRRARRAARRARLARLRAAQQAAGRRHDRARHPRAAHRRSSSSAPIGRLFPVGRLDAETTGLLLLTNDGELAARLMHPRHGVEKTYEATVRGAVTAATAAQLAAGIELDGRRTAPARVRVLRATGQAERRRDRAARGPQAPGAADVRGGRPSGASRCTARPTRGLRLGALAAGASRPLRPAEVELLRSAAAAG